MVEDPPYCTKLKKSVQRHFVSELRAGGVIVSVLIYSCFRSNHEHGWKERLDTDMDMGHNHSLR